VGGSRLISDRVLLPLVYAALILAAAWARSGGLNPATLWYDDVWVAVLTRVSSPLELLDIPAPGPLGFLSALWGMRRLISDPEISLQVLPFACGLISIPLVGMAVRRITNSTVMAVLAAAIMALNPLVAHYSIFIKHFTVDAVAAACLIFLAAGILAKPSFTKVAWGAVAGFVAFCMSFTSVIAGGLMVNFGALVAGQKERSQGRAVWPFAAVALAFNGAVLATYVLYLRHVRNPELISFWQSFYVPTESVADALSFLRQGIPTIAKASLPELLWPTWPLVFVGLGWLIWKPDRRLLAAFFGLFYTAWITMSALRMYPLGGERTDIFSFPATIALYCAGVYALTAWHRVIRPVAAVAAAVVLGVGVLHAPGATYFDVEGDSDIVRELQARARDIDAIVLYPSAGFIVGYYGPWSVEIERTDLIMQGYDVSLRRPDSLTLPHDSLEHVAPFLEGFLQRGNHQRVFYVVARQKANVIPESFVVAAFDHLGYDVAETFSSRKTRVLVFDRARRERTELGPEQLLIDVGEEGDLGYLGSGWWSPERAEVAWRWTVEPTAYLIAPLQPPIYLRAPDSTDEAGFLLRFRGRPFVFPGASQQTIEIDVDGRLVDSVAMLPEMSVYEVMIPRSALQRSLNEIRFRFAYNESPLDAGVSDDPRPLAVLFEAIEFVRR
jgi:hypothetical protein